jgi:hypothetical protein
MSVGKLTQEKTRNENSNVVSKMYLNGNGFFEKCEWMELALDCVQWRALLLAMLKLRFLVIDTSIVSYWR